MATYNLYFHIVMGLPASGKSYYIKHNHANLPYHHIIELDSHKEDFKNKSISDIIGEELDICKHTQRMPIRNLFIDGLILTEENLENVMDACINWYNNFLEGHKVYYKFHVYYWPADQEACLKLDKLRLQISSRNESSEITIKNAHLDNINQDILNNIVAKHDSWKDIVTTKFNPQEIYQISDAEMKMYPFMDTDYTGQKKMELLSTTWSGGGTWGNYMGESGLIEPDPAPEFTKFDEMLMELCPNITFLQYKKVYNETVTIESNYHGDYYGGTEKVLNYKCDLTALYDKLIEMNIISK